MAVPFVTPDAVRGLLCPDVSRPEGTAATLGDAALLERISTAQLDVTSALASSGNKVPDGAAVPELVGAVTAAIAAWLADLTYRQGKAHSSVLDPVVQRYQWAQKLLEQWSKGDRLPLGVVPVNPSGSGGDVQIGAPINVNPPGMLSGPPAGPSWADADPLYDPDRYRWGHERGWF